MEVNQLIATYRTEHGFSRKALADEIGVSRITIYRWESGERGVDRAFWPKVSKMMGIPVSKLAGIDHLENEASHEVTR